MPDPAPLIVSVKDAEAVPVQVKVAVGAVPPAVELTVAVEVKLPADLGPH